MCPTLNLDKLFFNFTIIAHVSYGQMVGCRSFDLCGCFTVLQNKSCDSLVLGVVARYGIVVAVADVSASTASFLPY